MAQPLISLLESFYDKMSRLETMVLQMQARISTLEEENADLRRELKEKNDLLDAALTDVDFLKVSHRLAESPDSLISTRRRIARLIRTVDNCISMLKEE